MKKLKALSIERLENKRIEQLDSLVGGTSGRSTFTGNKKTIEGIFDKDSQEECLCEEVTK